MNDTTTLTDPKPATASLIAHAGGYKLDEAALRAIVPPNRTDTWHPISHASLVDHVEAALAERGMTVERREFAVARHQQQFFGTFIMRGEEGAAKDFSLALGLRNSTDRSMSAGICSGARVFVCDNLALTGDIMIKHKHTANIDAKMPMLIRSAMDQWILKANEQANVFAKWKGFEIDVKTATDVIVRAAEAKAIPTLGILPVRREFVTPRHEEFRTPTVWSLYQAFTQYLTHDREDVSPVRSQRNYLDVHQILAKEFPVLN